MGRGPWGSIVLNFIKKAVDAKLCLERYAKSDAIGANPSFERLARIAEEQEIIYFTCSYDKDKDGNYYHTDQDAVVEVLTEEQAKICLSSYFEFELVM